MIHDICSILQPDTFLHIGDRAFKESLFSRQRQQYIDSAIAVNPGDSWLWQQRAMPYFKCGKHSLGMKYLDRAVELEPMRWLDYRGFIKAIFSKDYEGAITDMKESIRLKNGAYIMDHSHEFYIGLCCLQLDRFTEAEEWLSRSIDRGWKRNGAATVHFLDVFYKGIALMEQGKPQDAIACFDSTLKEYTHFSDAEFYKSKCLRALGKEGEADEMLEMAAKDFSAKRTFTEDNIFYEPYPYQLRDWYFPQELRPGQSLH